MLVEHTSCSLAVLPKSWLKQANPWTACPWGMGAAPGFHSSCWRSWAALRGWSWPWAYRNMHKVNFSKPAFLPDDSRAWRVCALLCWWLPGAAAGCQLCWVPSERVASVQHVDRCPPKNKAVTNQLPAWQGWWENQGPSVGLEPLFVTCVVRAHWSSEKW